MKKIKVSVIIPVYNGEKTLKECLDSVINQKFKNYEIIVVDNNSTDKTKSIIEELQKKYKNIVYIFEEKLGRGAARNAGIEKANGEIIAMTDSDCITPKNWIKEITKPIIKENENVVLGFELAKNDNFWTKKIQEYDEDFFNQMSQGKYINHMDTKNIAFKTSFLKDFMFDSDLLNCEDFELYLRIKKYTKIRLLKNIKVMHKHKTSFASVVRLNFNRGYWIYKIFSKHKKIENIKNEKVFSSISLRNYLLFIPSIINHIIKKQTDVFFKILWEGSWTLGTTFSFLENLFFK